MKKYVSPKIENLQEDIDVNKSKGVIIAVPIINGNVNTVVLSVVGNRE